MECGSKSSDLLCSIDTSIFVSDAASLTRSYDVEAEAKQIELNKIIQGLEEKLDHVETSLEAAINGHEQAMKLGDESQRQIASFEQRYEQETGRQERLKAELSTATAAASSAETRYDEVCQKMQGVEVELEQAEERADAGVTKIIELEEELKIVGSNVKSLEVSEEKAQERESAYEEQLRELKQLLKEAEDRATYGERCVRKLQKDIDRLEDETVKEREKNKSLSAEVNAALAEIQGM